MAGAWRFLRFGSPKDTEGAGILQALVTRERLEFLG
jgi:hypothetical protein